MQSIVEEQETSSGQGTKQGSSGRNMIFQVSWEMLSSIAKWCLASKIQVSVCLCGSNMIKMRNNVTLLSI